MIATESVSHIMANGQLERTHTPSQTYLSTRGGDYGVMISEFKLFQSRLIVLSFRLRLLCSRDLLRTVVFSCPRKSLWCQIGYTPSMVNFKDI